MTFIDFFSGIGGMRSGLEKAGHKCLGFCEFDRFARQSYKAMYDTEGEWESHDVKKAQSNEIPKADIWTFGFPCFAANTLILTHKGYIPIQDVRTGDLVLTHNSNWKPVTKIMNRTNAELWEVTGNGIKLTHTTAEHPYFVCRDGQTQFIACKDINNSTDYSTIAIPPINDGNTYNTAFWWVMGRCVREAALADFVTLLSKLNKFDKDIEMIQNAFLQYDIKESDCKEAKYVCITNYEFIELFKKCKNISKEILDLSEENTKAFLDGYYQGNSWTGITEVTMGVQLLENKIAHCLIGSYGGIYDRRNNIVCRRINQPCNTRKRATVYNISVADDESYIANGALVHNCQDISIAGKQKGIQEGERSGLFYEIMRLLAGLREEDKPEWLIAENVKNLLSIGNGFDFLRCLTEMARVGYFVEWQLFNTKFGYYSNDTYIPGIPQNRERIYLVGHLASRGERKILPISRTTEKNNPKLKQIGREQGSRENPNQGRVYDTGGVAPALNCMEGGGRQPHIIDDQGRLSKICVPKAECPTLRSEVHGNIPKVVSNELCIGSVGGRDPKYNRKPQGNRIYDSGNVSSCLACNNGGASGGSLLVTEKPLIVDDTFGFDGVRQYAGEAPTLRSERNGLKVAIPCLTPDRVEKRQNGRRFKEDGEAMFTLTAQDRHGVAIYDVFSHRIKDGEEVGTLTAAGNSNTTAVGTMLVIENMPRVVGGVGTENEFGKQFFQGNKTYDINTVSPSLITNSGNNSGGSILIREKAVLTSKRTEYGKEIRKQYENHEVQEQRKNMLALEPRNDGISNTLTTVQKDNLVLEIQSKEGYNK